MGKLQILTRDEALRAQLPWPDLYFTPAYGQVVEYSDQAPRHVAVWHPGPILVPFLLRTIPTFGETSESSRIYDIVSPYGYSGCWAPCDVAIDQWRDFRTAFRAEMKQRGVVSEFLRLGGLVRGREPLLQSDATLTASRHNDTISVDTSCDVESYWDRCEGRSRTAVRKACRIGYSTATRSVGWNDLAPGSPFRTMYEATMSRVSAQAYYFFDDEYFRTLYESLSQQLRWFITFRPDGVEGVMALTFVSPPYLHLHLVASEPAPMRDGAGNLCYDAMFRWACSEPAIRQCHLGGGLSADDPLYKFKKSFGGESLPFWVASSILDVTRYHRLVEDHARNLRCSVEQLRTCAYFPAYRTPARFVTPQPVREAA